MSVTNWIGGLGAAVVAIIGGILVYNDRQPDIRYEEGAYYRPGEEAITVLKLQNFGGSDAKDIVVTTTFPTPLLRDPGSDSESSPFTVTSGGVGKEKVTGTVKRLVPGQAVRIWYVLKNPGKLPAENFVAEIVYEGGKGNPGLPFLTTFLAISIVGMLLSIGIVVYSAIIINKRYNARLAGDRTAILTAYVEIRLSYVEIESVLNKMESLAKNLLVNAENMEAEIKNQETQTMKSDIVRLSEEIKSTQEKVEQAERRQAALEKQVTPSEKPAAHTKPRAVRKRKPDGDITK